MFGAASFLFNRNCVIFRLVLVLLASLLMATACVAYILSGIYQDYTDFSKVESYTRLMTSASGLIHELQKEKGISAGFIGVKGEKHKTEIDEQVIKTDKKKAEFTRAVGATRETAQFFDKSMKELANIGKTRQGVVEKSLEAPDAIDYYSRLVTLLIDEETTLSSFTSDRDIRLVQGGYLHLLEMKENADMERATLYNTFAADEFDSAIYERFAIQRNLQGPTTGDLFKHLDQSQQNFFTSEMKDDALNNKLDGFRKAALSQFSAFGVDAKEWFAAATARIDKLKKVEDKIAADIGAMTAQRKAAVYRKMMMISAGAGVSIVVMFALFIMFALAITKSLIHLIRAMEEIAGGDGDLTRTLAEEGNNEFSRIARAFNRFIESIRKVIGATYINAGQITKQAVLLSQVAEKTSNFMRNQNSQTHQAVASVEQMSGAVKDNASSAAKALQAAKNAENITKEGGVIVSRTRTAIVDLADEIFTVAQVIGKSNSVTVRIGEILDVIKGIADQTNLLALNAAIEAASAGEHGRGFAVVAEEVRTLSKRTNTATSEIQKIISQLLNESQKAVMIMELGSDMTKAVVENADRAEKSLQNITSEVTSLRNMLNQIAGATEEQSVSAETIADNMTVISHSGNLTSGGVEETEAICQKLSGLSEEMMNVVSDLKTGVPNLTKAKVAHLAWRVRLRKFMYNEATLSLAEAVDHHSCVFGKWYYSDGMKEFGDIKEMAEIEPPHAALHKLIREAVELKEAGNLDAKMMEDIYSKVEHYSAKIVDLLDAVELRAVEKTSTGAR